MHPEDCFLQTSGVDYGLAQRTFRVAVLGDGNERGVEMEAEAKHGSERIYKRIQTPVWRLGISGLDWT